MLRVVYLVIFFLFAHACSYLTESRPILKQREYEKMIAGSFDADYIGTENCLFKCHAHDRILDNFKKSVHAEQIDKETMLPLVNCETCHGPGGKAVEEIREVNGKKQCNFESLIDLKKLPAGAKNLACLKCHTISSTPNLSLWRGSVHDMADVACSDCHRLHVSPNQKVLHDEQFDLCTGCHKKIKGDMNNISHHPLKEKKMVCTDCHNPHGSVTEKLLKRDSVRDTCGYCHKDKAGPFAFEHADLMDDCITCHRPHGAINDNLLKKREPVLCLDCHRGHHNASNPSMQGLSNINKAKFYTRCSDCHGAIHGTNLPGKKMLR